MPRSGASPCPVRRAAHTHSARAASAAAHRAAGAPSYDQYQRCPTCQRTPTQPPRLAELNVNEPRSQTTSLNPSDADAVRRIAWANVGARDVAAREASSHLVLWASSEKASNGRKVLDELGVVNEVRQHLGRAWPALELMHARLTELSFAQEVRLMHRAAVFISLFGSALHNCRWMRPGRPHSISLDMQHSIRTTHAHIPTRAVAIYEHFQGW